MIDPIDIARHALEAVAYEDPKDSVRVPVGDLRALAEAVLGAAAFADDLDADHARLKEMGKSALYAKAFADEIRERMKGGRK